MSRLLKEDIKVGQMLVNKISLNNEIVITLAEDPGIGFYTLFCRGINFDCFDPGKISELHITITGYFLLTGKMIDFIRELSNEEMEKVKEVIKEKLNL